jgi:hypothetical protein
MQSVVHDRDIIEITFTPEHRRSGIAILFSSNLTWKGSGDNRFYVKKDHLKLLDDKKINYKRIS